MTEPTKRTHEDKARRYDKEGERLNPGLVTGGTRGVGAAPTDQPGGEAAKNHPLDSTDAEQAGTRRDPKFKTEEDRGRP